VVFVLRQKAFDTGFHREHRALEQFGVIFLSA
jgi:hypothetical protein